MAFLNPEDTIAVKKIVDGVQDNVYRNSPLLATLKRDCLMADPGGFQFQENFQYGVLPGQEYFPGEKFNIVQRQLITGGTVTPRYLNVPVAAVYEKLQLELNGPTAVFNYLDSLLQTAALSMSGRLTNAAYRHGQVVGADDRARFINGLDEALSDGSTNGFLGQTYANYLTVPRTQVDAALNSPMTGPAAAVSGNITYPLLEQTFNSVCIGMEKPNLILTTNLGMSFIKMAFQAQQRFETVSPDFGFQGIKFNGVDLVQDQYAPGSRAATQADTDLGYSAVASGETIWFLNTKHLRFYISTDSLYNFGFTGFIPAQDTSLVVGHYRFRGNLTCQAPRLMRYLFAVTG